MTVWQVVRSRGISQAGHATMPEFMAVIDKTEQGKTL
jgi:hypothetical protein